MGPPVVTFLILLSQNMVYNFIYLTEFSGTKFSYSLAGGNKHKMIADGKQLSTNLHVGKMSSRLLHENHYDVPSLSWTCPMQFFENIIACIC